MIFRLWGPQEGGSTLADHAESAYRQTGRLPEGIPWLIPPKLPAFAEYLWHVFLELHGSRTLSAYTPNPITYEQMEAFSRLTDTHLGLYEIKVVKGLDAIYLDAVSSRMDEKRHDAKRG